MKPNKPNRPLDRITLQKIVKGPFSSDKPLDKNSQKELDKKTKRMRKKNFKNGQDLSKVMEPKPSKRTKKVGQGK